MYDFANEFVAPGSIRMPMWVSSKFLFRPRSQPGINCPSDVNKYVKLWE